MVLEKTLESPLDCKEIKLVNPEGNQSWIFIGRTDAESLILWLPDVKNWLIWKDPDAGKDWSLEEKGTTEDEMFGWYHWLDGHEFEQAPGDGVGQGSLVCCSARGRKELHDWTTELSWQRMWAFQMALVVKNLPANARDKGDVGSIPGLGRSPGVGYGNPLQYSCLEKSMGRRAWWAIVHGITKSQTWLNNWKKMKVSVELQPW